METDWTLAQFGKALGEARVEYRRFVADGRRSEYEPWKQVEGQIYLGSKEFRSAAVRQAKFSAQSREVPKAQLRFAPVPRDELFRHCLRALGCDRESLASRTRLLADERRAVAHLLRRRGLLRLSEVGHLLGVGDGQASRLAAEGENVLSENPGLRRRLKSLVDDAHE
jgi:hypothetical protein